MCTSLSRLDGTTSASLWWSGGASASASASASISAPTSASATASVSVSTARDCGRGEGDVGRLQRLVEELRGQLERAQTVIRSLQARLRDLTPAGTPRKVSWSAFAVGGTDEDEGWQSSSDAGGTPAGQQGHDRELRDLVCRVSSLEEQLRPKSKAHVDAGKAVSSPGWVSIG